MKDDKRNKLFAKMKRESVVKHSFYIFMIASMVLFFYMIFFGAVRYLYITQNITMQRYLFLIYLGIIPSVYLGNKIVSWRDFS